MNKSGGGKAWCGGWFFFRVWGLFVSFVVWLICFCFGHGFCFDHGVFFVG